MITREDRTAIEGLAKQYKVARVVLFGSCADPHHEGHDIDLGVEGVSPEAFFRFYGDLIFAVSKPVDLVDLDARTPFAQLVRSEGICLYDGHSRAV